MNIVKTFIFVSIIGALGHYVGESLPRKLFDESLFPYKTFGFEKGGKIYLCIGIKKWKTKLPDMSRIMRDMIPKRIEPSSDSRRINILIKETCVAEFIHYMLCFISIGIYFIWKNRIGITLTVIYILCNVPFILIQRYNRPQLIRLRDRLLKREGILNANTDIIL